MRSGSVAGLACLLVGLAFTLGCEAGGDGSSERAAYSLARSTSNDIARVIAAERKRLIRLARLPEVRERRRRECPREMAARLSPPATTLGATDRDGDLYCLSEPVREPINVSDRVYFCGRWAAATWGSVTIRSDGQPERVHSVSAIRSSGEVSGVVLAPLSLSWLSERPEARRDPAALDVLVTDSHGTVLARGAGRCPPGSGSGGRRLARRHM